MLAKVHGLKMFVIRDICIAPALKRGKVHRTANSGSGSCDCSMLVFDLRLVFNKVALFL